jgi:hypothetical protein
MRHSEIKQLFDWIDRCVQLWLVAIKDTNHKIHINFENIKRV